MANTHLQLNYYHGIHVAMAFWGLTISDGYIIVVHTFESHHDRFIVFTQLQLLWTQNGTVMYATRVVVPGCHLMSIV